MPTPAALEADPPARLRAIVGKISRRLNAAARGSGMTPTGLSTLGVIAREGPLRLSRLAELESINPTMLSRVVANLDDDGLIRRKPDPDDRRACIVEVTAAGRRTHDKVRAERGRILAEGLAELGADELARIEAALPALEAFADAVLRERGR